MLFDEQSDPHELKNLAALPEMAAVKAELSKLVQRHSAGFRPAAATGR